MALNSLHWALAFFLVGLGERRTVSNVPELPELSHEVQQESFFDRCCHNSWGVRHDSWHMMHSFEWDMLESIPEYNADL
jgi:hypothetical protein